jgi:hypothetical protein
MKYTLLIILTLIFTNVFAQQSDLIELFDETNDNSIYTGMQRIIDGNDPISYIGHPYMEHIKIPKESISKSEGNSYLFEANTYLKYHLLQGRNGSSHFRQKNCINFVFNNTFRMINDSSNPILPANFKVGFQHNYILFSIDEVKSKKCKDIVLDTSNWIENNQTLTFGWLSSEIFHYSNGQSGNQISNFRLISDTTRRWNNYKNGNFSTNYINTIFNVCHYTGNPFGWSRHIEWIVGFGYQIDGEFRENSVFSFDKNQQKRYGQKRTLFYGQVRFITRRLFNGYTTILYTDPFDKCKQKSLYNPFIHRIKFNSEYISGDMTNYLNGSKHKSRFNFHIYYELSRMNINLFPDFFPFRIRGLRNVSLLVHYYRGRDYLNLRYDMISNIYMIGISFSTKQYLPPRLSNNNLTF